ncbi:hypothetical protein A2690_01795 [Candidatus Roizmanbacteria bacterium RIFCSPHIGHO2_01_FULL_39_12b]|uniref:Uncharacterized protein n=1 Tax=Candidatus Roizmanbacteria bacterium RIFCSPHIGHO2_01_FULL_39_12b TaxID=1802030 RepID=A0A1F7GB57_9BACT|nr:MAG: hypothetical protein A2690_01795 [Candidatus Roizmanbacteria bacterium RIFCSPHIGHO2_01_FULL_39_12b]OGK46154.1 MAG: hypothetical protein A3B46_03040 [Candidatus Roizmanbacteria bacterium RIFCSPLOWO2_01_FULL_39_19]
MITFLKNGRYVLYETKDKNKILSLDRTKTLAWINIDNISSIIVFSRKNIKPESVLSIGKYRLYDVKDEPKLTDLMHLELLVGDGIWQGYLLPIGLPSSQKNKSRVIPTREIITKTTY